VGVWGWGGGSGSVDVCMCVGGCVCVCAGVHAPLRTCCHTGATIGSQSAMSLCSTSSYGAHVQRVCVRHSGRACVCECMRVCVRGVVCGVQGVRAPLRTCTPTVQLPERPPLPSLLAGVIA